MVNFDFVIKRIEDLKGVRGDKHVAAILGLSPQDFSNRKKRGSLLPAIFEWAINESVNLDWLIKGKQPGIVAEDEPSILAQAIVDTVRVMQTLDEHDQKEVLKYAKERKALEGIKLFD